MKSLKTAILAVLVSFFAVVSTAMAEGRGKVIHSLPMTQAMQTMNHATTTVKTTSAISFCYGTYVGDHYETVKGTTEQQRLAVLAVPALCGSGWSYYGEFGSEVRSVQVEDIVFHLLQTHDMVRSGGMVYPQAGDNAFVADVLQLEFAVNGTKMSAYPSTSVFLAGRVAGEAFATQSTSTCNASGCTGSSMPLGGGYFIIDREWSAYPGTAVINADNQVVGIMLGADGVRTLIMGAPRIWHLMNAAGLNGKG